MVIYLQDLCGTAVDSAETTGLCKLQPSRGEFQYPVIRSEPERCFFASGLILQPETGTSNCK